MNEKNDCLGWAAGISVRVYGVKVGIRSNRPEWIDRVWRHLPYGSKVIQSAVVDRVYSIIIGGAGARANTHRSNVLYGDQVRLLRSVNVDEIFDRLESDLRLFVAELAHDRVFVHAGVVGWEGKAIVIPGRSFSGKSTLVAELLRAGATYYSDEYAVFDKRGRVHPFLKDLEIRVSDDWRQTRLTAGSFGVGTGTKPIPVGKILVTQYKTGSKWRPRQLSPGKAVLALLSNTVSARRQPEIALATLQRVVAEAQTLRGTRGEAHELVPLILERMEKKGDSEPD
ncbi:MAG TPA: hypothetical protein VN920_00160 [Pyrinomonadaceae bacterium]|nr:hypothetical protein [Pyrinomonadaceae bacterium]